MSFINRAADVTPAALKLSGHLPAGDRVVEYGADPSWRITDVLESCLLFITAGLLSLIFLSVLLGAVQAIAATQS
jgi:hypothetical protein